MMLKTKKLAAAKESVKSEKLRYFEGLGGRKTARARVRVYAKKGGVTINERALAEYFKVPKLQEVVLAPLKLFGLLETHSVSVHVKGSGIKAQADAARNGIARALVVMNEEYKKKLRRVGYMTRDAREVERKKPGLKKARKSPQWAKR